MLVPFSIAYTKFKSRREIYFSIPVDSGQIHWLLFYNNVCHCQLTLKKTDSVLANKKMGK